MGKENKTEKSFWKWLVTRWYFWVLVTAHFYLTPKETGIIINFLAIAAVWSFVFWIIYLIKIGGIHGNKKDNKNIKPKSDKD